MSCQSASRRTVLRGAALAGAAGLGVAACSAGAARPGPATPTAPVDLGSPDAVPVGEAKLYRDDRLLVSQPAKGEFRAFSAVCTHSGCTLRKIEDGEAECPCHHSKFDPATGKVLDGPAGAPLPAVPVRLEGGKLVAGPKA
ncbi:Rieske (2Fe-2S) protein [Streptomyces sp. NPDC057702]|uniref:Rieske (2Fe-2S) protein n=1 Tax=unclassified Streptomyces TaxID=2593676 RepID=UPI0036A338D8